MVESLVARIACIGEIGVSLGECCGVFGLDRAIEFSERLIRNRGDHVRKGNIPLSWMGVPKPGERAFEVSKLVGCKFPVSILLGSPKSLVTGLNCGDHQVADARQIFGGMRRGRRVWSCRYAAGDRQTHRENGRHRNCDRDNRDRAVPGIWGACPDHARTGRLERSLSNVIG
jgi:hypothetical protein